MRLAVIHPITRMIQDQYQFLLSMLGHLPYLLEDWIEKQEKEIQQFAESVAGDDKEVFSSVYLNEIGRLDHCYYEEELFNQAMIIMVYSFYESTLLRLAKENNVDTARPSKIAEKFGVTLNDDLMKISDFLFKTISPLRNQLCHNNSGTLFAKSSVLEKLCIEELVQKKVISVDDGRITFIDREFIKQVLDDEYKLLLNLAEICGYKTTYIGTDK